MNVTRRFGVELLAEVLGPVEFSGTMALYQAQLEFPFRTARDGQRTVSFTVGAGRSSYRRTRETRIARLDGSTVVYPGFRRFQVTAPTTFSIGVARDAAFGRSFSSSLAMHGNIGPVGGRAVRASSGWRSVLEAIDDHDRALRDPARGPDGRGRYRAALGICHSGSRGAESSSHCAAVRVDTGDELAIWMSNPVARGSLALEGSGVEAFIRIDRADREWLLRGPDSRYRRTASAR